MDKLLIFLGQPAFWPPPQAFFSFFVEFDPFRRLGVGGEKLWPVEVVAIRLRQISREHLDVFIPQFGAKFNESLDRVL